MGDRRRNVLSWAVVPLTERWWVIHDEDLRDALRDVASGHVTPEEVYARLCEHALPADDEEQQRDDRQDHQDGDQESHLRRGACPRV